ncbi:MAG: ArsR family transcriptional regulator [Actinomycetota bacterium]|nr:ArsR family transcriptional regulator [Actinomycetota bacterium]
MEGDVQREGRALGDPARHRLFCYIADAPQPVGVAELTGYLHLHHNAVRQHLAVLRDAGLVTEETEDRSRPGRPRLLYRLHPEVAGRWGTAGAYAWLAAVLSGAIRRKQEPRQAGRQHGHQRAAELAGPGDPADLLEQEMARRGFRPARAERGRRISFVLGRCPFAEVAVIDPGTICGLHLGLAEGLADGLGGLAVEQLMARDARRAGCRLIMRRAPAATGTPARTDQGAGPAQPATAQAPTSGQRDPGRRKSL